MAILTPYWCQQFLDDNGNPLSAGTVYAFESGTTTPKNTYSNYVGNVPQSHPVTLDAAGRVPAASGGAIWLGTGAYTLVLKDSAGNTVKTIDGINGTDVRDTVGSLADLRAQPSGSADGEIVYVTGYAAAGDGGHGWFWWDSDSTAEDDDGTIVVPESLPSSGRWIRFNDGYVDPLWYGASPYGTLTASAKFTAANARAAALGVPIRVVKGTYRLITDPTLTVRVILEVGAVIKWTGYHLTIDPIIAPDDSSQHFSITTVSTDYPTITKREFIRPEWFGAVADDSTACYTAFYAAIETLAAGSGGDVLCTGGTYRIATQLALQTGVRLKGVGTTETIIKFMGTGNFLDVVDNATNVGIVGLGITHGGTPSGYAIAITQTTDQLLIEDVKISTYELALKIDDADDVRLSRVSLDGPGYATADSHGIELGVAATTSVDGAILDGVYIEGYETGLDIINASDVSLLGCTFDACGQPITSGGDFTAIGISYTGNQDDGEHITYSAGGKGATVDGDGVANTLVDQLGGYDLTEHSADVEDRGEINFYKNHADSSTKTATVNNESLGIVKWHGVPSGAADWALSASIEAKQVDAADVAVKSEIELSVGTALVAPTVQAKISDAASTNDTSLYVTHNNGGGKTLQRVSVDTADSAGTGYRALRIPNGNGAAPTIDSRPVWRKYSITHEEIDIDSLTQDYTFLGGLPAKTVIHAVAIKPTEAFTGTGITTLTVSVGVSADTEKFASAFDVMQAPGNDVGQYSTCGAMSNFVDTWTVNARFTATGANLISLTAGEVDIWLLTSTPV